MTCSELIGIYDKYKQNYFTKMRKALFLNEPKRKLIRKLSEVHGAAS